MYRFIHRLYARDERGLFSKVIAWGDSIIQYLRTGSGVVDMQALVAEYASTDEERAALREDLRRLADYRRRTKERRARKLQARLQQGVEDSWDEAEVNNILDRMGLDADLGDMLNEEEDEGEGDVSSVGLHSMKRTESGSSGGGDLSSSVGRTERISEPPVPKPHLTVVPLLVKPFVQQLSAQLDEHLSHFLPRPGSASSHPDGSQYVTYSS